MDIVGQAIQEIQLAPNVLTEIGLVSVLRIGAETLFKGSRSIIVPCITVVPPTRLSESGI
jgi:hypothetical protein